MDTVHSFILTSFGVKLKSGEIFVSRWLVSFWYHCHHHDHCLDMTLDTADTLSNNTTKQKLTNKKESSDSKIEGHTDMDR